MLRALLLALAATLLVAAPAEAVPTWLAPVPLTPAAAPETAGTAIASNDAGRITAVWTRDDEALGVQNHIEYTQRSPGGDFSPANTISALGVPANDPDVGVDGAGAATLVWSENDTSVLARRIAADGSLEGTQTLAGATARAPRIAVAPNGAAVAVWLQGAPEQLWAAVRAADASTFGPGAPISPTGTFDPPSTHVALDPAGDAVVIWVRDSIVESKRRPAGADFDAVATPLSTGGTPSNAVLAMAPNGRATAMWTLFTGSDVVQFAERTVSPDFAGGTWSAAGRASPLGVTAASPSVAVDAENTAVAVWRASDGMNTFVQAGTRPSGGSFGNFQPLSGTTAGDFSSRIDVAPNGAAVAVWIGRSGARPAVQAARRDPAGAFGAVSDVALGDLASNPTVQLFRAAVAVDDEGNAASLWTRFRFGTSPAVQDWRVDAAGFDAAPPALSAVAVPASGTVGAGIGMAAAASDRWSPFAFNWAFGDGATADGAAVSHAFGGPGAFAVTVSATDAVGNSSSTSRQVLVSAAPLTITPRIDSTVQSKWGFDRRTGKRFFLFRLKVVAPPAGAVAQLRCRGKRCPFQSRRFTRIRKKAITLYKLVSAAKVVKQKNRRFRAGQVVQLRITAPGFIGKVVKYKLKRRKQPVGLVLCLPPGATKPAKC